MAKQMMEDAWNSVDSLLPDSGIPIPELFFTTVEAKLKLKALVDFLVARSV